MYVYVWGIDFLSYHKLACRFGVKRCWSKWKQYRNITRLNEKVFYSANLKASACLSLSCLPPLSWNRKIQKKKKRFFIRAHAFINSAESWRKSIVKNKTNSIDDLKTNLTVLTHIPKALSLHPFGVQLLFLKRNFHKPRFATQSDVTSLDDKSVLALTLRLLLTDVLRLFSEVRRQKVVAMIVLDKSRRSGSGRWEDKVIWFCNLLGVGRNTYCN